MVSVGRKIRWSCEWTKIPSVFPCLGSEIAYLDHCAYNSLLDERNRQLYGRVRLLVRVLWMIQ